MIPARLRTAALAATVAAVLAGCGQTGPLYLPERGEVVTRPAAAIPSTPAASTPAASTPAPAPAPVPTPPPPDPPTP